MSFTYWASLLKWNVGGGGIERPYTLVYPNTKLILGIRTLHLTARFYMGTKGSGYLRLLSYNRHSWSFNSESF